MNLFDLDDRVTAAAVAAAGTIVAALIQLRAAWRKEVSERARGVPISKKSRRGPVLAVLLLLLAAGVGGFALSQYLASQSDRDSAALRGALQTQVAQLSASAERLERAAMSERIPARRVEEDLRAGEGLTVTTTVGPCRAHAVAPSDTAPACSEQEALRVTLCASVPASAVVTAMVLYARPDDSSRPWAESRVAPGQDLGRARFSDKPFERAESEQTKQVCTGFSAWDAERAYSARLAVKYAAPPALREISQAMVEPVSEEH